MSSNIINFPRSIKAASSKANPKVPPHHIDEIAETHDITPPRRDTRSTPDRRSSSDSRRKKGSKSRSVEPNIQEIPGENGRVSYRVQIRKLVQGKSISFTKTFRTLPMARKWKKRKLAEIEIDGVDVVARNGDTVADAITTRLAVHKHLGRSAKQQLNWLKESEFGKRKLCDLTMSALTDLADDMLGAERQPQTVAGYLTILTSTLDWASRRDFSVPVALLREAMNNMWEDEIFARSEERNRRPSIPELDAILEAVESNKRQKIPLGKIIVFAIFSCRRVGEICRLRWEDLRIDQKKILVRDMKHPRKKKGNDIWCHLTDEALAIILSMPRVGDLIFPFKATSIGAAWRRHRDRLEIHDLRFHDLRHEGITRLFELGKPAAFVAKHSGHKNGGCLFRYEHVEQEGDKFDGWLWTTRVIGAAA